jgi:hypothetical protein
MAWSDFLNTWLYRRPGATIRLHGEPWHEKPPVSFNAYPPPFLSAHPNPALAGAASVFNLASGGDEPVVGLVQPDLNPDEALELLPFYEDQAERILSQAEEMMLAGEKESRFRNSFEAAIMKLEIMTKFLTTTDRMVQSREELEQIREELEQIKHLKRRSAD